jgi:hypothetical protein
MIFALVALLRLSRFALAFRCVCLGIGLERGILSIIAVAIIERSRQHAPTVASVQYVCFDVVVSSRHLLH